MEALITTLASPWEAVFPFVFPETYAFLSPVVQRRRERLLSSATMLTPKLVCSGVKL